MAMSKRGIVISLVAGVLMGCFYPFVSKAMTGENAPGPYAAVFFFVIGVAVCSVPVNYLLMRTPLDGSTTISLCGLLACEEFLAPVGRTGRGNLVYGRAGKLCGIARKYGGARRFLFDWSGGDDGLGLLGCFHLAGVCAGTLEFEIVAHLDVHLFRFGPDCYCGCAAVLRIKFESG